MRYELSARHCIYSCTRAWFSVTLKMHPQMYDGAEALPLFRQGHVHFGVLSCEPISRPLAGAFLSRHSPSTLVSRIPSPPPRRSKFSYIPRGSTLFSLNVKANLPSAFVRASATLEFNTYGTTKYETLYTQSMIVALHLKVR